MVSKQFIEPAKTRLPEPYGLRVLREVARDPRIAPALRADILAVVLKYRTPKETPVCA